MYGKRDIYALLYIDRVQRDIYPNTYIDHIDRVYNAVSGMSQNPRLIFYATVLFNKLEHKRITSVILPSTKQIKKNPDE